MVKLYVFVCIEKFEEKIYSLFIVHSLTLREHIGVIIIDKKWIK